MTGLCAGLWFTNRGRRVFFWVGGSGLWNIDLESSGFGLFSVSTAPCLGSGKWLGWVWGVCQESTLLGF